MWKKRYVKRSVERCAESPRGINQISATVLFYLICIFLINHMAKNSTAKRRWALPEGYSQKRVFFCHSHHTEVVRYTVCGIYDDATNCISIGVSRHDTSKFGSMCKAAGRELSFKRALDSVILLKTMNEESALMLFRSLRYALMHVDVASISRTDFEMQDAIARNASIKNEQAKLAQRKKDSRAFMHEQRMLQQKVRNAEWHKNNPGHKSVNQEVTPKVEGAVVVEMDNSTDTNSVAI